MVDLDQTKWEFFQIHSTLLLLQDNTKALIQREKNGKVLVKVNMSFKLL